MMQSDATHGRGTIRVLLSLFEKYKIEATWAVVGHLFLDHYQKENGIPHRDMARSRDDWYSPDPCSNIQKDPLFYGKDIIEDIMLSRIKHDIGYHSFSHVTFSECSRAVAEAEIEAGLKASAGFGLKLVSFVFPYNKIGHLDVLKQKGFTIYRSQDLGAITHKNPEVATF
jgi:peptidoglycan/xylan/chitin deacetylase (PgdA/CDA1 family)